MEAIISRCGLVCSECPSYLAKKNNDEALRIKTAEEWSRAYSAALKPADIGCDGCTADQGKLFQYCGMCGIRLCAVSRNLASCGLCEDYACDKLDAVFKHMPKAKETLDAVHAKKR